MAERRMFAKTIIDSDVFIDMPLSTQALYFHLSMRADDDGFVNNPKKIQRMIGAADDDLKLLIAKSFLIPFESGIVVIKHWKIHNYIRNDRYNPTAYQEERAMLEVKDNKAYTLGASCGIPHGRQTVDCWETQVRLGKDSIELDKVSIGEDNIYTAPETDAEPPTPPSRPDKPSAKRFVKPTLEEVEAYCIERNNSIDPQRFIDYYESNGWKVGKNPMKDWKAAIRTWERSEYKDNGGAKNAKHSGNSREAEPQPSRKLGTYI